MNDMSSPPSPRDIVPAGSRDPVALMNDMLTAQTRSLDALFVEFMGRAADNISERPVAAEAYARLAFRAQWNCRTSLEALAKADRLAAPRKGDGQ